MMRMEAASALLCAALLTMAEPAGAQSNIDLEQIGATSAVPNLPAGAFNNSVSVQTGNNNQSSASFSSAAGFSSNTLQQTQLGNGNSLQATQQGALNSLTQTQVGNNNPMSATQVGVGNSLTAQQYGNNTTGLGITQYGGAHATVTQSR